MISDTKKEFGDFQTPQSLAEKICSIVAEGRNFQTIIEPSCGRGTFLFAVARSFKNYSTIYGIEINEEYVQEVVNKLQSTSSKNIRVSQSCFFSFDWQNLLKDCNDPLLIIGNPPWVTNSTLGTLGSENLPNKRNISHEKGIDALTGKSNFDISEWMLLDCFNWLNGRTGTIAMLCKTSVARKVLKSAWKKGFQLKSVFLKKIDASLYFKVSVDACLLVCDFLPNAKSRECFLYESVDSKKPHQKFSLYQGELISDTETFHKHSHLLKKMKSVWRSGIKHDCAKVMELRQEQSYFINGFDEVVDIEDTYLYPILKSSDIYNGGNPRKWVIVTQDHVGQETSYMKNVAPKTWAYLEKYKPHFEGRKSSIYNNQPAYCIFGVGDYSFSPWKIAISGLYKNFEFRLINEYQDKTVVFDDTVYFLPCFSEEEATLLYKALTSEKALEFYRSLVFWDAKRPITADLLNKLNLGLLLQDLGMPQSSRFNQNIQLQIV
jgi:hypothetical protein